MSHVEHGLCNSRWRCPIARSASQHRARAKTRASSETATSHMLLYKMLAARGPRRPSTGVDEAARGDTAGRGLSRLTSDPRRSAHLVEKAVLWSSFSAEGPRWLLRAGTGVVRVCGHTLYKVLSITPNDTNVYNRAMWIQDTPRTRLQRHTGGTVLQPSQP